MPLAKNFKEIFIDPDQESTKWDNKVFKLGEERKEKELEEHLDTANELYLDEYAIFSAISEITKKRISKKEKKKRMMDLKELDLVEDVEFKKDGIVIKTTEGEIKVIKLTDAIRELRKDKDIETEKRFSQCHTKSMMISKRLGMPNDIVTGYIYGLSDKSKYVHTWVELQTQGRELVLDYTLNAAINKEGYYMIKHVEEISRISSEELEEDIRILNKFSSRFDINLKEYLLFRKEIMRDLRKNEDIYKEDRDI